MKVDAVASARAQLIGRLMIRDRDGDGRITAEEVRQSLEMRNIGSRPTLSPEQAQARLTTRMAAEMAADADKDDVITLAELLAFANEYASKRGATAATELSELMALDPNEDGVLTITELEEIALVTYARFDKNRNGLIDGDKIAIVRTEQQAAKAEARTKPTSGQIMNCILPKAGEGDEIVLVGTYHGDTVSNVSVVGLDGTTSVAKITVEAGNAPVYLVAVAASGVVWHVEGAVSRIARMVVLPRKSEDGPGAAVVGVPAEKVTFLAPGTCFRYFSKPQDGEARRARAIVETALGREVAAVIAAYTSRPQRSRPESRFRRQPSGLRQRRNALRTEAGQRHRLRDLVPPAPGLPRRNRPVQRQGRGRARAGGRL